MHVSCWPDIVVGGTIAVLFLRSAYDVLRGSLKALRAPANLEN